MKRPIPWLAATVTFAAIGLAAVAATPPNLPKALEVQRQLARERPDDPSVFNDLGNLLTLASDPAGAEQAYRRAVELAPAKPAPRFNLALLLQQRGAHREALSEYLRVIELAPENAWAHYQAGALFEAAGDGQRAIRSYARAFALEPRLAFAEYNPQVIDNGVLDEALLRAYHHAREQPRAPKIYEDPGRIAGLLMPPLQVVEEEGVAAAVTEPAEPPAARGPDTLSGSDLDERAINQASPQGAAGRYRPPAASGQQPRTGNRRGAQGTAGGDPGVETMVIPPTVVAPGTPGVNRRGTPGNRRVVVPPGNVRYRPGTASTGRLDLELIPGGPSTAADEAGRAG